MNTYAAVKYGAIVLAVLMVAQLPAMAAETLTKITEGM